MTTTSACDRTKRYRKRQRVGRAVLNVEVDVGALSDLLVETGFLEAWDVDDRVKLRAALEHALDYWAAV